MPDKDVKKALNSFENGDYVESSDILRKVVRKARNEFLKDKLGLEKNIEEPEDHDKDKNDDDKVDAVEN
jgi:hypothetical protein